MANLKSLFRNSVKTIFTVFKDLQHDIVIMHDASDGWDDNIVGDYTLFMTPDLDMRSDVIMHGYTRTVCILSTYSREDLKNTSFYDKVQVTDSVILVESETLESNLSIADILYMKVGETVSAYTVVDWDIDPSESLHTILIRQG